MSSGANYRSGMSGVTTRNTAAKSRQVLSQDGFGSGGGDVVVISMNVNCILTKSVKPPNTVLGAEMID